jgi:hypothetical protein
MLRCFSSYRGWLLLGAAILVAGYAVIWHGQHVVALLPFLVVAACPLAHLLMHSRHGGHNYTTKNEDQARTITLQKGEDNGHPSN